MENMKMRDYPNVNANTPKLINELRNFFQRDGYEVTQPRKESSGFVLKASKSNTWRDWIGWSHALTIRVTSETESPETRAWVGEERWREKFISGGLGAFLCLFTFGLLAPFGVILLFLALIGAYQQNKLSENTWNIIQEHMERQTEETNSLY